LKRVDFPTFGNPTIPAWSIGERLVGKYLDASHFHVCSSDTISLCISTSSMLYLQ